MEKMVYQKNRTIKTLASGFYYGYLYYIMSLGTHPTAYIKIPETHPLYKIKEYDDIPLDVHGGVTYLNDYLCTQHGKIEGKFAGWDYAHVGDYCGFMMEPLGIDWENEKKWTTQEILHDVKDACYQLKKLEENK